MHCFSGLHARHKLALRCRKNEDPSSANSAASGFHATADVSQVAPDAIDNTGTYQAHDNNSFTQPAGLITPASKESQRQGFKAQDQDHSPPQVMFVACIAVCTHSAFHRDANLQQDIAHNM